MKDKQYRKYLYISLAGTLGVILCIIFFFFLFRFDTILSGAGKVVGILMPFVYGAVIAYLLSPLCNFIQGGLEKWFLPRAKKKHRASVVCSYVAAILSLICGVLIVYILLAMVLPQVITSIVGLVMSLPNTMETWSSWLEEWLADNEVLLSNVEDFTDTIGERILSWVQNTLLPNMDSIISGLSAGIVNVVVVVKNIAVGIVAALYMLAIRKKLSAQAKKLLYSAFSVKNANIILEEIRYVDRMFGGFINGKLLDSLIMGCLCFVLMYIIGLPYKVLISVIIGVTNIIPFFGPFIGAIPCAVIVLTVSPIQCVYFVIMILAIQQIDGNIIGPRILGNTTGVSSFWVLFAIIFFGGLWGFIGMVIGVPMFAVIYDIVNKLCNRLLEQRKLATSSLAYKNLERVDPDGEGWIYVEKKSKEQKAREDEEAWMEEFWASADDDAEDDG